MGSTTTPTCLHMGLAWTHTDTTPVPTQWRTLNIKAKGTRGSNSATSLIRACEPLGIGESDLWALLKLQLTLPPTPAVSSCLSQAGPHQTQDIPEWVHHPPHTPRIPVLVCLEPTPA
ncbi:hypothetical protein PtA15_1A410 [Puccinia triticina]|uniref:Uncharacterized protein n=1 Tax=Puccinia triticina TaxID=208348 RepID=A0ABY7CE13_9BASI|nr:uncharacterized protein PtA15_1A410 [Puccinia triticina]WAQ81072.1 hypothetical protein PtA15_1A410 [Puccinia triticina]